jgi:hypothetical protein
MSETSVARLLCLLACILAACAQSDESSPSAAGDAAGMTGNVTNGGAPAGNGGAGLAGAGSAAGAGGRVLGGAAVANPGAGAAGAADGGIGAAGRGSLDASVDPDADSFSPARIVEIRECVVARWGGTVTRDVFDLADDLDVCASADELGSGSPGDLLAAVLLGWAAPDPDDPALIRLLPDATRDQ